MENRLRPAHDRLPGRPAFAGQIPLHPARSAIPKVIGVLAIVFASIGIVVALAPIAVIDEDLAKHGLSHADLGSFGTWMIVSLAISLAISGLHLAAGIVSLNYGRLAPLLMTIYAAVALVFIGVDMVVSVRLFSPGIGSAAFDDLVGARIGLGILAAPWPIVALVLMNLRSARHSCTPWKAPER